MEISSSNDSENGFNFFTPELHPLPENFLMGKSTHVAKTSSDDLIYTNKKSSQTHSNTQPSQRSSTVTYNNDKNVAESHSTIFGDNPQVLMEIDSKIFDAIFFKDLSSPHKRKKFWYLWKYQESAFKRRLEHSIKLAVFIAIITLILTLDTISNLVVDKTYFITFVFVYSTKTFGWTIIDALHGLSGVFLSLLFPTAAYYILPQERIIIFTAIVMSTVFIVFFISSINSVRIWFIVHNIYYFYILLNGESITYIYRQFAEFGVAFFLCIFFSLFPYPTTLHTEIKFNLRVAFEETLSSFKLLSIALASDYPGKTQIFLAHAKTKMRVLRVKIDYLHQKVGLLWVELLHDLDTYLAVKILIKILDNLLLFLDFMGNMVDERTSSKNDVVSRKMAFALKNFDEAFEKYSTDTIECFLEKKKTQNFAYRTEMKSALDSLWSIYRNMRYEWLYLSKDENANDFRDHLLLDSTMFCITNFFFSFTILDQMCDRKNKRTNNFFTLIFLCRKKLREKLTKKRLSECFTSLERYLSLLQNVVPVLICVALGFFTDLYPQTMTLIFPVGFCWSDRLSRTFSKNVQRLLGTTIGCFYSLLMLTLIGQNEFISIVLFGIIFLSAFIMWNPANAYLGEVTGFTSIIVLLSKVSSAKSLSESIFFRATLTFAGVVISVIFMMLLSPKRAITLLKQKLVDNIVTLYEISIGVYQLFDDLDISSSENNFTNEDEIIESIRGELMGISGDIWEPMTLHEFTHNERIVQLNDTLFSLQINFHEIFNLLKEAEEEPNLFMKETNLKVMKQFVKKLVAFSGMFMVLSHSLNGCDITNFIQTRNVRIKYSSIFKGVENSLKNVIKTLKSPKIDFVEFEKDFTNSKKSIRKIDQGLATYFKCVKKLLQEQNKDELRLNVSFKDYRQLWGMNTFFFCLRQILRQVVDLQQSLIFIEKNPPHLKKK